jgi:hypothetical protein
MATAAHDGVMITSLRPSTVLAGTDAEVGPDALEALAHDIARYGIASFEPAVAVVAEAAAACGACPLLVAVVVDGSAPGVVRERAYGLLAAFLARTPDHPVPQLLCA